MQAGQVGLTFDDAHHGGHNVALTEGRAPGRARQQGRTPGPPVGFLGGWLASQELWSGVAGRAGDEAGAGQVLIVDRHRNAEVDEDGAARRTDDVRGLDVSVNDVGVVNGRDRRGQVIGQGGHAAQRNRPGGQDLRQGRPFDVLRDNEGLRRVDFRVDDVRDEGRAHRVNGASLTFEARPRVVRRCERRVHRLEGDTRATLIFS
jgi:hypothetical protein